MPPATKPNGPMVARCPANQAGLDRLAHTKEHRCVTVDARSLRYSQTLQRAMTALAKCPTAIETHADAVKLPHVGRHCATIICPTQQDRRRKQQQQQQQAPFLDTTDAATVAVTTVNNKHDSPASVASVASSCHSLASLTHTLGGKKRSRLGAAATAAAKAAQGTTTTKEKTYQRRVAQAEAWHRRLGIDGKKNNTANADLFWRVVLVVDGREPKANHMMAKCHMSGIPCQVRHLPIGDLTWIVQGVRRRKEQSQQAQRNGRTKNDTKDNDDEDDDVAVEFMLGTIIERKTPGDLKSSLFGTRYWEQRLRLQHSGLPQVILLLEGRLQGAEYEEHLHTALWETRIQLGFSILETEHMADTIDTLRRLHRRLVQRTFPTAFGSATALPTFGEAHSARSSGTQQSSHRHRKRRLESLMELTFDTTPMLPFGTTRFLTYPELKAKIERDREAGTQSVGSIFLAMLKQIPTVSGKKCHAVAAHYPTPHALMAAYGDLAVAAATASQAAADTQASSLVAPLVTAMDPNVTQRQATIGPKSAKEIHLAFGMQGLDCASLLAKQHSITSLPTASTTNPTCTSPTTLDRVVKVAPPRAAPPAAMVRPRTTAASPPTVRPSSKARPPPPPSNDDVVDLLSSPDRKPAAIDTRKTPPQLPSYEPKTTLPVQRSLNTSLGFLDSSSSDDNDDDDPVSPKKLKSTHRTQASVQPWAVGAGHPKPTATYSLSSDTSSDDGGGGGGGGGSVAPQKVQPAHSPQSAVQPWAGRHGPAKVTKKCAFTSGSSSDDDSGMVVPRKVHLTHPPRPPEQQPRAVWDTTPTKKTYDFTSGTSSDDNDRDTGTHPKIKPTRLPQAPAQPRAVRQHTPTKKTFVFTSSDDDDSVDVRPLRERLMHEQSQTRNRPERAARPTKRAATANDVVIEID